MSTPIAYDFDATQYAPRQTLAAHPVGKFPFRITGTEAKPTKDSGGGYFAVTFTTPSGSIIKRYNIWNQSQAAVDIAHGELSALCFATGVMRFTMRDNGAALMGAQGQIEVGQQVDKVTGQPNQYTEVKKVFDMAGNDPSQPLTQQPQAAPNSGFIQPSSPMPAPQMGMPGGYPQSAQSAAQMQPAPGAFPVDQGPMPGQSSGGTPWAAPAPQPPAPPAPGPFNPQQPAPGPFSPPQQPAGNPWGQQPQAPEPPRHPQAPTPYPPGQGPANLAQPQPAPGQWAQQPQAAPQGAPAWAQQR